jgi:dihydropteroate synthase
MKTSIETLSWQCGPRTFFCGARTLIAGVLNVTPDSFSDGGQFVDVNAAVEHALAMAAEGADMIDIGGESSRPGSDPVPLEEELRRVLPVIEGIRAASDVPISVDTTKAEVVRRAIGLGVEIVNDISALCADPAMAPLIADKGVGVILMHMRGAPRTMQQGPEHNDVIAEVEAFLEERMNAAIRAGIEIEQICVDPGIGFGKTLEHNLELIAAGWRFRALGTPLLVGMSRKSFIGALLDLPANERLEGSLAAAVTAVLRGADILRVHDVRETRRAVTIADAIKPYVQQE